MHPEGAHLLFSKTQSTLSCGPSQSSQVPCCLQVPCPSRPWRRGTSDQGLGHYPSDTSQAGLEVLSRGPQGTCFS